MKKSDLQTGMLLLCSNCFHSSSIRVYKVMFNTPNGDIVIGADGGWNPLDRYDEDLSNYRNDFNIEEIYIPHKPHEWSYNELIAHIPDYKKKKKQEDTMNSKEEGKPGITKSQLQTGMILKMTDGTTWFVDKEDGKVYMSGGSYNLLSRYEEDLTARLSTYHIKEVWVLDPTDLVTPSYIKFIPAYLSTPKKKMTLKKIEEELGYRVELVDEAD